MLQVKEANAPRRMVTIRRRIKSLIRLAYFNAYWLEEFDTENITTSVQKNIRVITNRNKTDSLLTLQQKSILNKRKEYRTESEITYLSVVLGELRCFNRYPEETRRQLAMAARFVYYPPGRYIFREDDPPLLWYYILAGEVSIRKNIPTIDGIEEKEVLVFVKGYTLGEFSMMYGTTRSRSVLTLTHCEFLTIDKSDFDAIVRKTIVHHYNIITSYVKQLPYFESFDQKEMIEACLVAKVKEYEHQELILGDDVGHPHYTYFVVKGKVQIIHHLMFTSHWDKALKKNKYTLYDPFSDPKNDRPVKETGTTNFRMGLDVDDNPKEFTWETPAPAIDYFQLEMAKNLPDNIHSNFIKVYTVNEEGCFNLGENLRNRFVIAEATPCTVCLLLPRLWLYKRNIAYIWTRLVQHFNLKIPNAQKILDEYVRKRLWERRKKNIMKELLRGSHYLSSNTMTNVPYSIRIRENMPLHKDAYSNIPTTTSAKHR